MATDCTWKFNLQEEKKHTEMGQRVTSASRRFAVKILGGEIIWMPTALGAVLSGINETWNAEKPDGLVNEFGDSAIFYEESEYDENTWKVFRACLGSEDVALPCKLQDIIMMLMKYGINKPKGLSKIAPSILMSLENSDFTKIPNPCPPFAHFLKLILQWKNKAYLVPTLMGRMTGFWSKELAEILMKADFPNRDFVPKIDEVLESNNLKRKKPDEETGDLDEPLGEPMIKIREVEN